MTTPVNREWRPRNVCSQKHNSVMHSPGEGALSAPFFDPSHPGKTGNLRLKNLTINNSKFDPLDTRAAGKWLILKCCEN